MNQVPNIVKGGSFVLEDVTPQQVFTPEDMTEEQRMIATMTAEFIEKEVSPQDEQIEGQNFAMLVHYLKQAGELGLLGAEVPEEYGGADLDQISAMLITENMTRGSSFALSHGAHVGIGSLPIVLFGTEAQKQKYLPDLATGKKIAAYCLTEPSSGSDALGAKTTAVLSADGKSYTLNGTKQYITNAGFADVFIVYAKVDGEKFTAFIVDKETLGVSTGPEERKMGIKGSSTRSLILEEAEVSIENTLGEIGKGHLIAFNILNVGRYKLAAGCVGTSKWVIELSVKYAKERKQFNRPLTQFPLIQKKLAEMAIRAYAMESMVFRTGGLLEQARQSIDPSDSDVTEQIVQTLEEYALECSINKVYASEALDFIADEGVQIHGGYGYTEDYLVERIYRDARINRIFEGTNEINRLLIPATLLRKAMKGEVPLFAAVKQLQEELIAYLPPTLNGDPLQIAQAMIYSAKKMFLLAGGVAVEVYQQRLEDEQEILESLADMMIEIFAMESAYLRACKATEVDGANKASQKIKMTTVCVYESFAKVEQKIKGVLAAVSEGDSLRMQLSIVNKLVRFPLVNLISLKREIAQRIIEAERYIT
ncbi:acyl-CoA dehydrogenase [Ammoniphilus oxalaticus]|uniref:Acyl-CoA dehydrogenase n=1 Tax=Ammoniphilus oxalaticus TaxID=66863 RepID=A0A419SKH0_9BACL|nr:acyl-CoA dehydrogenase family protein [Ammoniphilus oxalaticus]RKD24426.1 acyl-CoA dehydrogenase [Ammoniphilus oxalaticus]